MQCPSCGASYGESGCCSESQVAGPSTTEMREEQIESGDLERITEPQHSPEQNIRSTLIEFPGIVRSSVPEWRRELSERVREVQERRAREAALEAEEAERRRLAEEAAASQPQLELLPQTPLNPLVAAALRRIERANQQVPSSSVVQTPTAAAAAIAYVSGDELNSSKSEPSTKSSNPTLESTSTEAKQANAEKTHNLVVVPSAASTTVRKAESRVVTKRLISENDPSLNYLNTISTALRIDEIHELRAGMLTRLISAMIDLLVSVALFSPFVGAVALTNGDWHQLQTIVFSLGFGVIISFLYLTSATALTGRTLGMRLLSLRTVDRRTGLIPTGAQSACRAFIYLASLLALGLPIIFALFSRDGYPPHDRLTRTVVVRV